MVPDRQDSEYVLQVVGLPPHVAPRGLKRLEAEMLQWAGILRKGARPLVAASAYVSEQEDSLSAELRFPREPLTAAFGTLEFAAMSEQFDIAARFDLKRMIYRGRLEL